MLWSDTCTLCLLLVNVLSEQEIYKEVRAAFAAAEKKKKPALNKMFEDVYDTKPQRLLEQVRQRLQQRRANGSLGSGAFDTDTQRGGGGRDRGRDRQRGTSTLTHSLTHSLTHTDGCLCPLQEREMRAHIEKYPTNYPTKEHAQ